ncbi:hypothetical protein CP532_0240 [Ophiocordyceps camponoti-leonardi (nom. inval.)]|nr:hypothetical protein CP532_0240 [Ophiocordyceps camponoti-leonardi (nom. inval.)]
MSHTLQNTLRNISNPEARQEGYSSKHPKRHVRTSNTAFSHVVNIVTIITTVPLQILQLAM